MPIDAGAATTTSALAEEIRRRFVATASPLAFSVLDFWGTAVIRPGDQDYVLVSTHAEDDRLDLIFVHESRAGLPGVLSLWGAGGIEVAPAMRGLLIRHADRLRLDDSEALRDGDRYRFRSARGEAAFEIAGRPALRLVI